jgi:hypothetical protein
LDYSRITRYDEMLDANVQFASSSDNNLRLKLYICWI